MKTLFCNVKIGVILAGLLVVGSSQANSSFNTQAAIEFSIENPSSALAIDVWFEQGWSDGGTLAGDATSIANYPDDFNPEALSTSTGIDYVFAPFSLSGFASNGDLYDRMDSGWYYLQFTNNSDTSMSINLTLKYDLLAAASGQFADTDISLDYYLDEDYPANIYLNASVFDQAEITEKDSILVSFDLGPGSDRVFHTDISMSGNLSATTLPLSEVPLPPAIWLFLSGMAIVVRRRLNPILVGTGKFAANSIKECCFTTLT